MQVKNLKFVCMFLAYKILSSLCQESISVCPPRCHGHNWRVVCGKEFNLTPKEIWPLLWVSGRYFSYFLGFHFSVVSSFLHILYSFNSPASGATCSPENETWHLPFIFAMLSSVLENKYKVTAPLHTISGFHTSVSLCKSGGNSEFCWEKLLMEKAASIFWLLEDSEDLSWATTKEFQMQNKATTQFPREKEEYYYA